MHILHVVVFNTLVGVISCIFTFNSKLSVTYVIPPSKYILNHTFITYLFYSAETHVWKRFCHFPLRLLDYNPPSFICTCSLLFLFLLYCGIIKNSSHGNLFFITHICIYPASLVLFYMIYYRNDMVWFFCNMFLTDRASANPSGNFHQYLVTVYHCA